MDNEIVAAEQQVGVEKKEVPQLPIEKEFSIHKKKECVCLLTTVFEVL